MSTAIVHGIPRSHRAEPSPIHGMDTGIASDANVRTFARPAVRADLPGRTRPHGRRSIQTACAASRTCRPYTSEGGVA